MHLRADVLGVPISVLTMEEAIAAIDDTIFTNDQKYVCTIDVHALVESRRQPDVRDIYQAAGIAAPDGMPLVWLLRHSGHHAADRICGPDLMPAVFRKSQQRGYRHFLYGASEETLLSLKQQLDVNFPGVKIVGHYSPPFRPLSREEELEVDRMLNAADPDIVWVGLGAPKQDRWMAAHRPMLNAPMLIGVGAAFDMIAGKIKRAPRLIRRTGCEWMFRLAQEPRRLTARYLRSNLWFALMLAGQARRPRRLTMDAWGAEARFQSEPNHNV
jgi:N-acetylglucosaminyldiphosphoundecaprenol N-acetyl-beta-D-mannosaminyltransferase